MTKVFVIIAIAYFYMNCLIAQKNSADLCIGEQKLSSERIEKLSKTYYEIVDLRNNGLLRVTKEKNYKNRKYGIIDSTGKEVIPCKYADIVECSDTYLKVAVLEKQKTSKQNRKQNNNYDFYDYCIDKPHVYEWIYKWGITDTKGNQIMDCKYTDIQFFGSRFYVQQEEKLNKRLYAIFGITGKPITPFQYQNVQFLRSNHDYYSTKAIAVALMQNNKWQLLDTAGKALTFACDDIIPLHYTEIRYVQLDTASIHVDEYGYEDCYSYVDSITAIMVKTNGKWGIINPQGKIIVPCIYDKMGEEYGITIDTLDNLKMKHYWANTQNSILLFKDHQAAFFHTDNMVLHPVFNMEFDAIGCTANGFIIVKGGHLNYQYPYCYDMFTFPSGKYGFHNFEGKEIIPCIYDDIRVLQDEQWKENTLFVMVNLDGKWGLRDMQNKEILPCKYDDIYLDGAQFRATEISCYDTIGKPVPCDKSKRIIYE